MWIVGLPYYDDLIERLKNVCGTKIHLEEIPSFLMNLIIHKIPFTGPDMKSALCNYTNDPFVS